MFKPEWAKTISGQEEGVFGWTMVNSLRRTLGLPFGQTWGAFDLGGASTQITFIPPEVPLSDYYVHRMADRSFPLYTHSYLKFGQDQVVARLYDAIKGAGGSVNPCTFTGQTNNISGTTITGAFDNATCKTLMRQVLGLGQFCPSAPCAAMSVYQPNIPADMQLSFFSGFSYTADFFNCSGMQPIRCVGDRAAAYCSARTYAQARAENPSVTDAFLQVYCISAVYANVLLTEAYRLDAGRIVRYANVDGTNEITWALGAMIALQSSFYCPACRAYARPSPGPDPYGLVIDAGSSGTRIYIYTWPARTNNSIPQVTPAPPNQVAWALKTTPGISTFVSANINETAVRAYIKPFIDFAVSKIPESQRNSTPIYFFATAGMRLVNATQAANMYALIRNILSASPFLFRREWAKTIAGEEEGVYGWDAVNLLRGTVAGPLNATWGVAEMGGASMQFTYVPTEAPLANYFEERIGDRTFPLYTHSYLQYGRNQFMSRFLNALVASGSNTNPCGLDGSKNTVNGTNLTGNFDAGLCKAAIRPLLGLNAYCPMPPCSIYGEHLAPIPDNMKLLFFGTFADVSIFFNCSDDVRVDCMDTSAMRWCDATLDSSLAGLNASVSVSDMRVFCAYAAYFHLILTEAFKLSPSRIVRFAVLDNEREISWTMGALMDTQGQFYCRPCMDSLPSNSTDDDKKDYCNQKYRTRDVRQLSHITSMSDADRLAMVTAITAPETIVFSDLVKSFVPVSQAGSGYTMSLPPTSGVSGAASQFMVSDFGPGVKYIVLTAHQVGDNGFGKSLCTRPTLGSRQSMLMLLLVDRLDASGNVVHNGSFSFMVPKSSEQNLSAFWYECNNTCNTTNVTGVAANSNISGNDTVGLLTFSHTSAFAIAATNGSNVTNVTNTEDSGSNSALYGLFGLFGLLPLLAILGYCCYRHRSKGMKEPMREMPREAPRAIKQEVPVVLPPPAAPQPRLVEYNVYHEYPPPSYWERVQCYVPDDAEIANHIPYDGAHITHPSPAYSTDGYLHGGSRFATPYAAPYGESPYPIPHPRDGYF